MASLTENQTLLILSLAGAGLLMYSLYKRGNQDDLGVSGDWDESPSIGAGGITGDSTEVIAPGSL